MKIITYIFLIPLIFTQTSRGQTTTIQNLNNLFDSLYSAETFNGCILVAEQGEPIYTRCLGLANETTKEELNLNSVFELASISKQFTAISIAILEEQGALSFDDKLVKYFPELNFYDGITINHLIHHTSGIYDYGAIFNTYWDKTKIATNADVISLLTKYPKVYFKPGKRFKYSNTGYVLLASIIERVSGKRYANFVNDEIFTPLDMKSSYVFSTYHDPKTVDNYALGYVYSEQLKRKVIPDSLNQYKYVYYLDGIVGDGMVKSSVKDLLKWDRAMNAPKIVSRKILNKLFLPVVSVPLNSKDDLKYGFAWFIQHDDEIGEIASHSGGWAGYRTSIEKHLDKDLTIIFLQNTWDSDKVAITRKQIRTILYNLK